MYAYIRTYTYVPAYMHTVYIHPKIHTSVHACTSQCIYYIYITYVPLYTCTYVPAMSMCYTLTFVMLALVHQVSIIERMQGAQKMRLLRSQSS